MATGSFLTLITLLILSLSDYAKGRVTFTSEPTEKSVLEGNDVTLQCVIEDYDAARHTVLWYRAGLVIVNNTVVTEESGRISIISDPKVGQFNLQITKVRPSDDHAYECQVCDRSNANSEVIRSSPARLDVQTTPAPEYPICSPLEKADFAEGEAIVTRCSSERANPPVVLQWYQGSVKVTSVQEDENGFRSATHRIVIAENHNGAVFQCKMTSNAISTYEKSCTVGPLSVRYTPRVTIVSSQEIFEVGDRIRLDCDSNANPQPYKHAWNTPEYAFSSYKFTGGSRYLETTASVELNGTDFSCNATNTIGSGMSEPLRIVVMPRRSGSPSGVGVASNPGGNPGNSGLGEAPFPGKGTSSAPEELDNMLLLLVIAILSIMIITLAIVLLFKCHNNRRRSSNADVVYNGPSTIFNSSNIDRAWDGNSIYYEPQDQISTTYDPMWQTTLPLPPELQRNVGIQVPYHEDPHYAEIELDWDEEHGTLEL